MITTSRRATFQLFFPAIRLVCWSYVTRIVWLSRPQNAPHRQFSPKHGTVPDEAHENNESEIRSWLLWWPSDGAATSFFHPYFIAYRHGRVVARATSSARQMFHRYVMCHHSLQDCGLQLIVVFPLAFHGGVNDGINVVVMVVVVVVG
jgi:hypothetical protein